MPSSGVLRKIHTHQHANLQIALIALQEINKLLEKYVRNLTRVKKVTPESLNRRLSKLYGDNAHIYQRVAKDAVERYAKHKGRAHTRAGLVTPLISVNKPITKKAHVMLTALVEYKAYELMEMAGLAARKRKAKRVGVVNVKNV